MTQSEQPPRASTPRPTPPRRKIALALTGASGAPYFLRCLERLRGRDDVELHLVASEGGKRVLHDELGMKWSEVETRGCIVHPLKNIGASIASGSFGLEALVVVPCSMSTLSAISVGLAENLVHRAAAVQLKESRRLILVPRETPLSLINLRAMVTLREAGAVIMPASPGFYQQPETVTDLVDTVVDRIIDHLQLADETIFRWNPQPGAIKNQLRREEST
ncbi:Flavin prenyltransferase UbiX [Sulfidibacter corallicola]|uniref:Flavin prenyltransferase UbiX n=1 Tax=Sulfidibacter corallicola TaxID=2818388 RepID=A0A8A4TRF8_SULCO|nr:UbiX family flavin prenyltransferase [Sulfidibacter corallicola]QTD51672.1 UbiX family flavin prenyltransferase [Sulfidibacter corallicola]